MKKNRPGTLVTVLAPPASRQAVVDALFRDSTTIGLRWSEMTREVLQRSLVPVRTPFGEIRCKVASRGEAVMNVSPEFDDCARQADVYDVSVKEIQAAAVQAYRSSTTERK